MHFREALTSDIAQIQIVRNAVKENTLSNPLLVTDADCETYITQRGKGWVCTIDNVVVGFSIIDMVDKNVWALFVHPNYDNKGIGKHLHNLMLNWYFTNTKETVWLSTTPNTRAEKFYTLQGWEPAGMYGKDEVKFTMEASNWQL